MRRLAIAISLLVATTPARGADPLRMQIETELAHLHHFYMNRDVAGLKKYLRPRVTVDYHRDEYGTSLNLDQLCAALERTFKVVEKMVRSDAKITDLTQNGQTATATVEHVMTAIFRGRDKKAHVLFMIGASKDTYVKQHGKWLLQRALWFKHETFRDGKQVGAPTPTTKSA